VSPNLPPELIPDYRRFEESLGRASLPEGAPERLREYGRLLYEKSADLSLIGKSDRTRLFTRHILDSLNALSLFPEPPDSALDIGSGGGLPGIPLAIAWPEARVILLESRERKSGFLEHAVRLLRLTNARVVCARLEDHGSIWRDEPVASAFVRALGDLPTVLAHASRAVRDGGRWVYFLGDRLEADTLGEADLDRWRPETAPGTFGGRLLSGRYDKAGQ
jgi:16S rRNA (guanine527-N7)-methyltransferase